MSNDILEYESLSSGSMGRLIKAFARHESFHPRYGWLKKGFDAAKVEPDVFLKADATVTLGVGKNMVRAIRYWCRAFKVLEEYPYKPRGRAMAARPTPFGNRLLGANGWDPYLEHPGSLWLLQWMLLRPPCMAPAWHIAFNALTIDSFTEKDLVKELLSYRDANPRLADVVENSLKKDVECLIHMYAFNSRQSSFEEGLNSPFLDLELLHPVTGDRGFYRFNRDEKGSLPDAIVCAASLDFVAQSNRQTDSGSISLRRLVHDEGSPGRCFKLSETSLERSIEAFSRDHGSIRLSYTAGMPRMSYLGSPRALAEEAIVTFYSQTAVGGA